MRNSADFRQKFSNPAASRRLISPRARALIGINAAATNGADKASTSTLERH